ncbi:lamin tail domain-containing protein [Candidatus Woesearchaeota archaeon]|nr:lamin tail domain-containing protein [Candidatus Woesearchaeota archaeon]
MKWVKLAWIRWMLTVTLLAGASQAIVIQEVLYDPASESGGEAVLLYNQDNVSVDISGWTLATEASSADATLPPGSFLSPKGTLLVADIGWEATKDPSLPSADHEESITMYNTDSGIALKDASGLVVDAVGWGSPGGIPPDLYEGTPHPGASEGMSLVRTVDTDDNSADFVESEPSFIVFEGEEIPFMLEVNASDAFVVMNTNVSMASVAPVPGVGATIALSVELSSPGTVVALFLGSVIDLEETDTNFYQTTLSIPFYQSPGDYSVGVTASNGTETVTTNMSIGILPVTAIGLDVVELGYDKLIPGKTIIIEGDKDPTTDKPTLRNLGNTPVDILLSAKTPLFGSKMLSLSNVKFSLDGNFSSALSGTLKTTAQTKKVSLAPNATLPLSLQVKVPSTATPGSYLGALVIGAKEST